MTLLRNSKAQPDTLPITQAVKGVRGAKVPILQGSIERFDLASVLQFLALNTATGILEIRDSEEHGSIYLVKGRVEGISLPVTDDRLGIFLIKAGFLREDQLTRVLMEESASNGTGGRKPLGQRLVEKGFTSESVVRQAMSRLTMARMFEIAHWHNGVFTYDEPAEMPEFQIAIHGNVQELLLQTQLRIDHGERARKTFAVAQHDTCLGCRVSDCSPSVKQKYLKKDTCLWRKMSSIPDVRTAPGLSTNPLHGPTDQKAEEALQGGWVAF
jgi:Domain of unknown function (DUF4388)